jgi:hypothetical protein
MEFIKNLHLTSMRLFFLYLILLCGPVAVAQKKRTSPKPAPRNIKDIPIPDDGALYCGTSEKDAWFGKREDAWKKYLETHNRFDSIYHTLDQDKALSWWANVRFIVQKDGHVSDVAIEEQENLLPVYADEIIRLITASPKWNPAVQGSGPVKSYRRQKISFVMPAKDNAGAAPINAFEDSMRHIVKVPALFKGISVYSAEGKAALYGYLQQKTDSHFLIQHIPDSLPLIKDTVWAEFQLDTNGLAKQVHIEDKTILSAVAEEVRRLIIQCTHWQPLDPKTLNQPLETGTKVWYVVEIPVYLNRSLILRL